MSIRKWWRKRTRGIDYNGWKLCEFVSPRPVFSLPANSAENPDSKVINNKVEIAYVNFDIVEGRWYKVRHPDGWIHEADLTYEKDEYRRRMKTQVFGP